MDDPKTQAIRCRFAPSPTGFLHIGSARTALFNFLFAQKNQGVFVLRIEDTDPQRSKPEYEKDIIENLKWLGIDWDEGPDIGGPCGPYRQTEKLEVYEKLLRKLVEEEKAYCCFCPEEELETQRQYQQSLGQAPQYSGKCRALPETEVAENLKTGKPAIIRLKNTAEKKIVFHDIIRGKIEFDPRLLGDFAVARSLKSPLYNFSVVVDDAEMLISHVIRGEDLLSNTPKQILIQEALGFPKVEYGHLPIILAPDRTKLSKRAGAVGVSEYRQQGYLAEAMNNFMILLGWHPEDDREIFTLKTLVKEFSLERVQKQGAIFNFEKLDWLNGFYLRQLSLENLAEKCLPFLIEAGFLEIIQENAPPQLLEVPTEPLSPRVQQFKIKDTGETIDFDFITKACGLYQQRLKKLSEIVFLADYFFKQKIDCEKELLRWKEMPDKEIENSLKKSEEILKKISEENWTKEEIEKALLPEAELAGDRGYLLWPLRVALTGKAASAGPFEVAWVLGKEKTLKRIKAAKELISRI